MRIYFTCFISFFLTAGYCQGEFDFDFTAHNFSKGTAKLDGVWKFYKSRLIDPQEIPSDTSMAMSLQVPLAWNQSWVNEAFGTGTYYVKFKTPLHLHGQLSLYIPSIHSAAKVWINGSLNDAVGRVGTMGDYLSAHRGMLIHLPSAKEYDVVIQVANYESHWGGIISSVELGYTALIRHRLDLLNGIHLILIGSLFAMFVYMSFMYMLYRSGGSAFIALALLCFCVAVRGLVMEGGPNLLPIFLPNFSWDFFKKMSYGLMFIMIPLLPIYVGTLFRKYRKKKMERFFAILSACLTATVFLFSHDTYSGLLMYTLFLHLICIAYSVNVIYKASKMKSFQAKVIMLGAITALPFVLVEMLRTLRPEWMHKFHVYFMLELGVLIFLLSQIYLLSRQYAISFKGLEKMIAEKTKQLTQSNLVKDKLLSVLSHDVRSPINSLKGLLNLFNKEEMNSNEASILMKRIETDMCNTTFLIDNILLWVRTQIEGFKATFETINLHTIVNRSVLLFKAHADTKKITILNEIPQNMIVHFDANILNLVLRNLISNAIKFTGYNGTVVISMSDNAGHAYLIVSDNGTGMPLSVVESIRAGKSIVLDSNLGTIKESGHGFGLMLCIEFLNLAESKLYVESKPGGGTMFKIRLRNVG
jgi:two-component system sensor histidine kinase ChiS